MTRSMYTSSLSKRKPPTDPHYTCFLWTYESYITFSSNLKSTAALNWHWTILRYARKPELQISNFRDKIFTLSHAKANQQKTNLWNASNFEVLKNYFIQIIFLRNDLNKMSGYFQRKRKKYSWMLSAVCFSALIQRVWLLEDDIWKNYFFYKLNVKKDCLWKQRTHYWLENGSLGFTETLHKQKWSLQHCLRPLEQSSIFKYTTMGPMIPKEMKYNLHYEKYPLIICDSAYRV